MKGHTVAARPLPSPVCHPTEYRFELPFPVAGKKSCYVAIGIGKFTRVVLADKIRCVEECIRLIVASDIAHLRGQITDERRAEIHEMAHRRRLREGVGRTAIARFWEREWLGYLPGFELEVDVELWIECIVGLTEETDRVVVSACERGRGAEVRQELELRATRGIVGPRGRNGRRRDLDGSLATIMDGLNRALFHDDRQVSRITAWKSFEIPFPKQKKGRQ